MTPGPYHYSISFPRQTCARGNLLFLEKKKEEKIKTEKLDGLLVLTGGRCCTESQINMQIKRSMKLTRNCETRKLYLCTGSAPGFVQRITCNCGKTCTKSGGRERPRQPRLMGKTFEDVRYSRN